MAATSNKGVITINLSTYWGSGHPDEIHAIKTRINGANAEARPWAIWTAEIDACLALREVRHSNVPLVVTGHCPIALACRFARPFRSGTRKITYVDSQHGEYVVNNNEFREWYTPDPLHKMMLTETIETFAAHSWPIVVIALSCTVSPQQLGSRIPVCIATWCFAEPFTPAHTLQFRDNIYVLLRDLHRRFPVARFAFAATGENVALAMLFATVYNVLIYGQLILLEPVNGVYQEVSTLAAAHAM